jgi:hypothetical protein
MDQNYPGESAPGKRFIVLQTAQYRGIDGDHTER